MAVALFQPASFVYGETLHLAGREGEAISLATRDFLAKHYSTSGHLRHYTVEIERHGKSVEILLLPDEPRPLRPNEAGLAVAQLMVSA